MLEKIAASQFRDLYIGPNYCDVRNLRGTSEVRVPAPPDWADDIHALRELCIQTHEKEDDPEFTLSVGNAFFRVTHMPNVRSEDVFYLRRVTAELRRFASLGLPPYAMKALLDPKLSGLVLFVGKMGVGKTTSAYSYVAYRMQLYGGLGVLVEDPPEGLMEGEHGKGRVIQTRATEKTGGYRPKLKQALRTGADLIMIGEIRDTATAVEAVMAGRNGHLILSTVHGDDEVAGIDRLVSYCKNEVLNANDLVASALSAVIWQDLEPVKSQSSDGFDYRLKLSTLVLTGDYAAGTRSKIREGVLYQLQQDILDQKRAAANNLGRTLGPGIGMDRRI